METVLFSLNLLAIAVALGLALPAAVVCFETWLALVAHPDKITIHLSYVDNIDGTQIAVLIPAHNEEAVLGSTLATLVPTLPNGTRLLVVADNCTDQTAAIARQYGAQVFERQDVVNRGKGFALRAGLEHLAADLPSVVVFLDADCQVAPQTVQLLASAVLATGRPVQGLNLCPAGPGASWQQRLSSFAFRFKNQVRCRGLFRWAGLCHLMGTGMALPWELARNVPLEGRHLTEDMQWGIDLAIAGRPALFVEEAEVTSPLPSQPAAIRSQRTRWEHGHLRTLLTQVPRLLKIAIASRRWSLAALALDLAVPPLAMLVLLLVAGQLAAFGLWQLGGSALPLAVLSVAMAACGGSVLWAWHRLCRNEVPLGILLRAPTYAIAKLPMYAAFLFRPQRHWVRTPRE